MELGCCRAIGSRCPGPGLAKCPRGGDWWYATVTALGGVRLT